MRDQIFISYSREDSKWLEMFEKTLKPLVADHKLKLWSDRQIRPGEDWRAEIDEALASAKVAVLLVSTNFLASEFINKCELPALLEANQRRALTILWVPISPSLYRRTKIASFQAAYDPTESLDSLSPPKRNKALVEISEKIMAAYAEEDEPRAEPQHSPAEGQLVVLLYKRRSALDERVLQVISDALLDNGYRVFIDKHMKVGVRWAQEIAEQVSNAYAVIPLLSPASVLSEMFVYEIETASDAQQEGSKPYLLPVRINFEDPLPDTLASILDPIQYTLWRGPHDDQQMLSELLASLRTPPPRREIELPKPPPPAAPLGPLEPPWGAVPLKSRFYVERPTDSAFFSTLEDNVGIVLVKGPRQVGKTSLLARGLQRARASGFETVVTDLQALNTSHLESIDTLFQALCRMIAEQLGIKFRLNEVWDPEDGANTNFRSFLKGKVLAEGTERLVWALDEADRLFNYDYRNDVFALFRALFNARQLDPDGPWDRLTIAIIYATEAHLFITDPNMSPFNVGTPIELRDFGVEQVADLNRRFPPPAPLGDHEVRDFCQLVGGHPYLVRRGLYEMKKHNLAFDSFRRQADSDDGPYGDHLHRILALLARDPEMLEEVRAINEGRPGSADTADGKFYRLRSAGVIAGDSPQGARIRCDIYRSYLARHIKPAR